MILTFANLLPGLSFHLPAAEVPFSSAKLPENPDNFRLSFWGNISKPYPAFLTLPRLQKI